MIAQLAFRHRSALLALVGTGVAAQALSAAPFAASEAVLGVLLAAAGALLRLVSIRVLGKSARVHHAGGRTLHVVGPYAWVRNPLYVANALITGGLAALAAGLPGLALATSLVLAIYALAVSHEELALEEVFGEPYREYRRQVPRWLPRLRAAPADAPPPAPFGWGEVLRRERALVVGVPAALLAVVLVRRGQVPLVALWAELSRAVEVEPVVLLLGVGGVVGLGNVVRTERKLRRKAALRAALAAELLTREPIEVGQVAQGTTPA